MKKYKFIKPQHKRHSNESTAKLENYKQCPNEQKHENHLLSHDGEDKSVI